MNVVKQSNKLLSLLLLSLLLSGCASTGGQIASFEDLTTEASKEGSSKIPQYRVISIPGMLPFSDIGGVHFYKSKRKPSSAIGLSTSYSYAVESTIDGSTECDEGCLSKIRGNILEVKNIATNLIEDKINISSILSRPPNANATDAEKKSFQDALTTANKNYTTTRNKLDTKHKETVESIQNNGVLLFRWNTNTKKSGFLGLGSIFGVSGAKDETKSGFGLISGLKTSTLYLGNDILNAWGDVNRSSKYINRCEITTYVMQAQYILYMSEQELSTSLGAKLKASYKQLADISDTMKALDNIEIQAALSKVSNLSNIGVIGESKRNIVKVNWLEPNLFKTPSRLDGWQTIYAVKSDLKDILDMISLLKNEPTEDNKANSADAKSRAAD